MAIEIAASSPLALEVGKKVIDRRLHHADFDFSTEALTVLQASPDMKERTAAFLGKRKPDFCSRG
ncbi:MULTISPECIES: hypothetical protein [unclassified Chelatococcus]|uniref:hypothetical protein n=1 Tax=unclassified Chelatococcus TaxID=2638111 RepID=UPI001BCFE1DF|nr:MULTISPECIES: hypothetical protein [unclassified Chelatococcus]MBS7743450.1 hypothetical protein [Chelatococcus sp. HY11]MBX3547110.1 hypothetical protein [Chelatococcus sp.]